jgi:hypothetical protein
MKLQISMKIALCVSLLASWPAAAWADAVLRWNENAARAATAACLHAAGTALSNPACMRWSTRPSTTP